jgi:hypothetical protein
MQQGIHRNTRFVVQLMAAVLALSASQLGWSAKVHTWTDENGVVHFSDSPRPDGQSQTVQVEDIYKPGTVADVAAPDAGTEAAEPVSNRLQEEREQRRKDRAERLQAQEETEKLCARHRDRLARVEPARRVMYANEDGEMVRMDDDERLELVDESRKFIAENCD